MSGHEAQIADARMQQVTTRVLPSIAAASGRGVLVDDRADDRAQERNDQHSFHRAARGPEGTAGIAGTLECSIVL